MLILVAADMGRPRNGFSSHASGNTPAQFQEGQVGHSILHGLGNQRGVSAAFEPLLGMPETVGNCLRAPHGALRWHFRVQTPAVDLRALDTRTMRAFPGADPHGRPDLLSPDAITEQLSDFIGQPVLVVPAPMAPPPRTRGEQLLLWLNKRLTRKSRIERLVYLPDRGDEWQPTSAFFKRVMSVLPSGWVCLGGDTHLAYAAHVDDERGRAAIFCSSGMLRETVPRRIRQALGFSYPWPLPRNPVVKTAAMTLRYLRSDIEPSQRRYQYLSKNNIGELRLFDTPDGAIAKHCLWWQDASGSLRAVRHTVALGVSH